MCGSMSNEGVDYTKGLVEYSVSYRETCLKILSDSEVSDSVVDLVKQLHTELNSYIRRDPLYQASYEPLPVGDDAPAIVRLMAEAAHSAGVGPMAAVAGAFSQLVGEHLLASGAKEVIVENGGDIYLKLTSKDRLVGVYAGSSRFSDKIALRVKPKETPLGVCTSSASVGPSVSLGESDSVTVVAESTVLADAAATTIGNEVKGPDGVKKGVEKAKSIDGIKGVLIIKGGEMGVWGRLPEIVKL